MTPIQEKLLEILKAFDAICRKHDIEYFLTGGSALGAIRHHGFIPWDDDIDVGVRRSEWKRLRPLLREELPDTMLMVDYVDYPTYRNPIAKVIDKESAVLYRASLADECPKGQYLEIFMHDPVPEDRLAEHKKDFLMYCELMTPYFSVFHEKLSYKRGLKDDDLQILKEYRDLNKWIIEDVRGEYMEELLRRISRFSEEESDYLLLEWGVNTCYYPLENFEGVRYERFEDMEVPVARRACDNLRIDYGNSWTDYPPASARVAHVTVGDENISGDVFMDMINRQIDPKKTRRARLSQKEVNIRSILKRVESEKKILSIRMAQAVAAARRTDIAGLYREGNYAEIASQLSSYILVRKQAKGYDLAADLDPESKDLIARALVMLGRISDAENVLGLPRNMFIRQAASETAADILRLTKAAAYHYDGMDEEARKLLDETGEELRGSLTAEKVRMRVDVSQGSVPEGIEALLGEHPDDLELVRLMGDKFRLGGRMEDADRMYDRVLAESSNGMDIIDIRKIRQERS